MKMQFGKYSGERVNDLPDGYLRWLMFDADFISDDLLDEVKLEAVRRWPDRLPVIDKPYVQSGNVGINNLKIKSIYRRLAQKFHPDHGGDNLAMAALNEFYEILTDAVDS